MHRRLRRNLPLFYLYYLFKNASFQRGIFLLFLMDKGFHNVELGTLQSTLYLVNFASEVPTGMLGDRYGRRWSVLVGLTLTGATAVLQLVLGGLTPFLVIFAVQGLAFAFISGSDAALFYDSLKAIGREADYVKLRARMGLIGSTSLAIAMAVGGLIKGVSWTTVYLCTATAMAVAAGCVALMIEAPVSAPDDDAAAGPAPGVMAAMRAFATEPVGRALVPLVLASGFLHAALTPYFVFAQELFEAQHISVAAIAVLISAVQVAAGVFGLIAERVSREVSLRATFFVTVLGLIGCLLLNALDQPALCIGLFVAAMTLPEVLIILVDNHLQEKVPSRVRASIFSAFSLVEACLTGLSYVMLGAMLGAVRPAVAISTLAMFPMLALGLGALYFVRRAARAGAAA